MDSSPPPNLGLRRPVDVGPPVDVVAHALEMEVHVDEIGDLLIALLGWDQTVQQLASSPSDRAGEVLLSVVSWLLLD